MDSSIADEDEGSEYSNNSDSDESASVKKERKKVIKAPKVKKENSISNASTDKDDKSDGIHKSESVKVFAKESACNIGEGLNNGDQSASMEVSAKRSACNIDEGQLSKCEEEEQYILEDQHIVEARQTIERMRAHQIDLLRKEIESLESIIEERKADIAKYENGEYDATLRSEMESL